MKAPIVVLLLLAATAAAQSSPLTFEQLSSMAQQAYEADHLDEAVQLYSQAVKMKADWAQGWWALGMIEYERDHYPECRDALTRMVAVDASAAPGWALLGLCEFRLKQYDSSFQHLKKAHMLVPPTQSSGQLMDIADYHLALLLTEQGAFEVAQELLTKVARRVHNNPEMIFGSGLACLRMPIFPVEVPADHRDVVAMAGKAFWDLATETPQQAEADFDALVSKYPKFPNVHYFYGSYLAAHHADQCEHEFLQELAISPESVPSRVQLALRYILERRLDEALKFAREAVSLSPDSVGTQLALAKTLRARGDNEGALAAFLEAKRLDPETPQIRLLLANVYRSLDRLDDMRREQAEHNRLTSEQANWP